MARLRKLLSQVVVYGNQWLSLRNDVIEVDGERQLYSVVERSNSVAIVPLDPKGRTVLLKQFRHPTGTISWEFPMGGIEEGERPEQAARRELREETGLETASWELLGVFHPIPGLTPQKVWVYKANCSENQLSSVTSPGSIDDIEEVKLSSIEDVCEQAAAGSITDGLTLITLLYVIFGQQRRKLS